MTSGLFLPNRSGSQRANLLNYMKLYTPAQILHGGDLGGYFQGIYGYEREMNATLIIGRYLIDGGYQPIMILLVGTKDSLFYISGTH